MNFEIHTIGNGSPITAVIGCVHGDEVKGKKIIEHLKGIKILKGMLIVILANPKALKCKKRFVCQDLNRSFPGKKLGNYEEKLAYDIKRVINKCDYVIDVHFTTTNADSLAVVTKLNGATLDLINMLNPKRVALMKKSIGMNGLIYHCRAGVALEYGENGCQAILKKTLSDIYIILGKLGMISKEIKKQKTKTRFYKITNPIKKNPGYVANKNIKNFNLVKKGKVIAKNKDKELKAKKDFYPVLFGEKAYTKIFGFAADRIDIK